MTAVSTPVLAILEVFQGALADQRFGEIDGAALAGLVAEVEAAATAVAEQQTRLTELQTTLSQRQDALLLLSQRALAYARVYAESDQALSDRLNRIALPRMQKPRKVSAPKSNEEIIARPPTPDSNVAQGEDVREARAEQIEQEHVEQERVEQAAVLRKGKRREKREAVIDAD